MADQVVTKACSSCERMLAIENFYSAGKNRPGRFFSRCKECERVVRAGKAEQNTARARKWRIENPGASKTMCDAYRAKHSDDLNRKRREDRSRIREVERAYRKANRDRRKVLEQKFRDTHPGYRNAEVAAWRKSNRAICQTYERKRRAQKVTAGGSHTAADIADIRRLQRDRCAVCAVRLHGKGHVDHIQPLAKGGSNARSNLQLTCPTCNSRKRDKDPIIFMQERGFLL